MNLIQQRRRKWQWPKIFSQFVFCVLLCARLYTWTTRFQSVARKIVTFLSVLPASAKIYFLQAQGRTPPHYLYMLRQTPTAVVASENT